MKPIFPTRLGLPLTLIAVLTIAFPSACAAATTVIASPHPGSHSWLQGIAALSGADAWAVGGFVNSAGATETNVLQWNGNEWAGVLSPSPGNTTRCSAPQNSSVLFGVSAISVYNVWAVGAFHQCSEKDSSLILHWNGASWESVPSPNRSATGNNDLYGVYASSETDAWAVGSYDTATSTQALILHWNGTSWAHVCNPSVPGSVLTAVGGSASDDVWAVGVVNGNGTSKALAEHWNGDSWSLVSIPKVTGATADGFSAVASTSPTDVWAVGQSLRVINGKTSHQTMAAHWNGRAWTLIPPINPPGNINVLTGVAAHSPSSACAVGFYFNTTKNQYQALFEEWNGASWALMASPNAGKADQLLGAAAILGTDTWAVGAFSNTESQATGLVSPLDLTMLNTH